MEPQVIIDQPIPLLGGSVIDASGQGSNPVLSGTPVPTTQLDKKFPPRVIARETISQSLNTKTKSILADYTFESLGAISIYSPIHPLAHISISGDGIIGVNANGDTTFAIDGATGDAIFAGELRSGTLITGEIVLGDGSIILDDMGLKSTTNFLNSITSHGVLQQFTTTSYVDLTNSAQTFTLERSTNIILFVKGEMYIAESAGNTGNAVLFIDIDGTIANNGAIFLFSGNSFRRTNTVTYLVTLAAGTHTIKLKARFETISAGAPVFNVNEFYFTRLHLGS